MGTDRAIMASRWMFAIFNSNTCIPVLMNRVRDDYLLLQYWWIYWLLGVFWNW